jgi:hypothetical protein
MPKTDSPWFSDGFVNLMHIAMRGWLWKWDGYMS